jgi:hypothetical protein
MWMTIAHAGDFAQAPERAPPVSRQRFLRTDASPEPAGFYVAPV